MLLPLLLTSMTHQITKGIKIAVRASYQGTFYKNNTLLFGFKYTISITNNSKDTVQLTSRKWLITDALNYQEVVEGEGVIGLKPVLQPGETHTYSSGCFLRSPYGAMRGTYTMVNFTTTKLFKVKIPSFKLSARFALN